MRKTFGTKTVGGDTKENKRISFCLFNVIRMRFLGGLHQLLFVTFEDVGGSPSVNGVNNLSSMMGLCHHAQPALSGLCSRLVGYRSPTRQFFFPICTADNGNQRAASSAALHMPSFFTHAHNIATYSPLCVNCVGVGRLFHIMHVPICPHFPRDCVLAFWAGRKRFESRTKIERKNRRPTSTITKKDAQHTRAAAALWVLLLCRWNGLL